MTCGKRLLGAVALLTLGALPSCSAKEAVSVSGSLGNVQMSVSEGVLVTTLAGSFDVSLELGERASEGTNVQWEDFALVDASTGAAVVPNDPVSVVSSVPSPIHLDPGQSAIVSFVIDDLERGPEGAVELTTVGARDALCAAPLMVKAIIRDSAQGARATPLSSQPFTPSGC